MFNALWKRYVYLEEAAGDAGATGGAAAPAAAPAGEAPAADPGLTPPGSLLDDPKPVEGDAPKEGDKPVDKPVEDTKPIEYTDFKMPEGLVLDATKLGEFKEIAAGLKIDQEGAQKLMDIYTKEFKEASEAPMRAWTSLQNQWRDEVKNDPIIGGANLDKNLAATKAGFNNLLGEDAPKFWNALNITGAGNNPDIVRGLMKAAAPHAPATAVNGSPGKPTKTAGATLYPTQEGLGNGHQP
jgi:hypothetical protein